MNILLWVLQILLALHTAMGAVWKFSNSAEATMPSLKAIPNGVWQAMGGFELLISFCLIVPAFYRPAALLVPIAAGCIFAEMLVFSGMHLSTGDTNYGPIVYWLVVALLCGLVVMGRLVLRPL